MSELKLSTPAKMKYKQKLYGSFLPPPPPTPPLCSQKPPKYTSGLANPGVYVDKKNPPNWPIRRALGVGEETLKLYLI